MSSFVGAFEARQVNMVGRVNASYHEDLEQARLALMNRQVRAYWGDAPQPLLTLPGSPNDNVNSNKARYVVDKGAQAILGNVPRFDELIEGRTDPTSTTPAEQVLMDLWAQPKMQAFAMNLATMGGVTGDVFLKVLEPAGPGRPPRVNLIDTANIAAYTDAEDCEQVNEFCIIWQAFDHERRRLNLRKQEVIRQATFPDGSERWTLQDFILMPPGSKWQPMTAPILWGHPWSPILHCQNLPAPCSYYGRADLTPDVLDLVAARSGILSHLKRIIRIHAHPKTIASGVNDLNIEAGVDGLILLQSPDAKMYNLEMASDLSSSLATLAKIDDDLYALTAIPPITTGKVETAGELSGLALQILYGPLVAQTNVKRATYGGLIQELNSRLLELSGVPVPPMTTTWQEFVPVSEPERLAGAQSKIAIGVSKATVLTELGYDAEDELTKSGKEHEQAMELETAAGAALARAMDRS